MIFKIFVIKRRKKAKAIAWGKTQILGRALNDAKKSELIAEMYFGGFK
jgi:hypothetical protein